MGTRNLTIVFLEGKYRVAQYCQWDGYPDGQGATVLNFLKNYNRPTFIDQLLKLKFVDGKELEKLWEDFGAKNGMATMDVADRVRKSFPQFSRDTGAAILELIQFGKVTNLKNDYEFAADSLFCEWAYVIDLDNNALEVYKGFNKTPLTKADRFVFLEKDGREYYPIKKAATYSLYNLPTVERMELDTDDQEEESEV